MKCPLHWTHVTRYIKSKKDLIINSSLFHKHLFWTNIGISVALSGAGDYFIQRHESGSNNRHIDYKFSTCQKSLTAVRSVETKVIFFENQNGDKISKKSLVFNNF